MARRQDFASSTDDNISEDKSASSSDLKEQTTVTIFGKVSVKVGLVTFFWMIFEVIPKGKSRLFDVNLQLSYIMRG